MPRLESHLRSKEWWTEVIVFTATDQTLNKAFVQHFEALIKMAREAGRYSLKNGTLPVEPSLSERESAIYEGFMREVLLCLPLLGINLAMYKRPQDGNDERFLFIHAKGIKAQGVELPDGFLMLAGSEMSSRMSNTIPPGITRLRAKLKEQGGVAERNQRLLFESDYRFSSPSTAATVVLGACSNGRCAWKDQAGKTLKELQLSALGLETEVAGGQGDRSTECES